MLSGGKNVDVERMPVGIEVMPSQQEALDGFSMSPATAASRCTGESRGVTAVK